MKTIRLPIHSITITLDGDGNGSVSSHDLLGEAPSMEYRAAVDGLLNVIVGHACAGINVESPAYLEGVEVALDAIVNQYDG